ncbi:MAG TPA: hypothetical protein VG839_06370 [Asticcacaulis sp.]|nr:hypothetical protein [Asticcacaulis sp.]
MSLFPWFPFASETFSQPILPNWSFNLNEINSSAPDTERRIVAQESYGRQLGKLTDAVAALIKLSGKDDEAFTELLALKKRVEKAKEEATADRLSRLSDDLRDLKKQDPDAFKRLLDGV